MAGEIILGYDGSEGAKAALPRSVELAKAFGVPLVTAFAYGANPIGGVIGDIQRETAKLGERLLAEAADQVKALDAGVRVEPLLVDARPVEGLVGAADQYQARILVVGGNGRSPVVGTLLGSVSYKVLHQTDIPVLVVQPPG
jgi:nucleotide-binding universal stress UspA family protein